MKKTGFLLTILIIIKLSIFAQGSTKRTASFKEYGQYLQTYMSMCHDADYKGQFTDYCEDYLVVVNVNIDTSDNIIDAKTISDKVSAIAINYVMSLLNRTNRQWQPQVTACKEIISDTITCFFHLFNKTVTPLDRQNRISEEIDRSFRDPTYLPPSLTVNVPRKFEANYCYVFLRI